MILLFLPLIASADFCINLQSKAICNISWENENPPPDVQHGLRSGRLPVEAASCTARIDWSSPASGLWHIRIIHLLNELEAFQLSVPVQCPTLHARWRADGTYSSRWHWGNIKQSTGRQFTLLSSKTDRCQVLQVNVYRSTEDKMSTTCLRVAVLLILCC